MADKRTRDLKDVIREETRRGRRPIDLDTVRRKREKTALLKKLLTLATKEEFVEPMLAYGLIEGSPEFLEAPDGWREFRP
jgi:hypothetical protein